MLNRAKQRAIGDMVLRWLLALVFMIAAGMKLAAVEFEVSGFARFGYAPWFMYVAGALQLLGAALLLLRGYTAFGALLLAVLMVSAVGSHLRAGDPVLMAVPAFTLLILLSAVAYVRRGELRISRGRVFGLEVGHGDVVQR